VSGMAIIELTTVIDAPIDRVFDLSCSIDLHTTSTSKTSAARCSTPRTRRLAAGAEREMEISLEGSYRKDPPLRLNKFGLPEKSRYRTADVCALLGISPDLLRWRFLTGKYSEARRDGRGRVFNVEDLESILAQNKKLGKGRESPKSVRRASHLKTKTTSSPTVF